MNVIPLKDSPDENLGKNIAKESSINPRRLKGRKLENTTFVSNGSINSICLNALINVIRVTEKLPDDKGVASIALGAILRLDVAADEGTPAVRWLLHWLFWTRNKEKNRWGDEILKWTSRFNTLSYLETRANYALIASRRWTDLLSEIPFSFQPSPLLTDNFILWMEEDGYEEWDDLADVNFDNISNEKIGRHPTREKFLREMKLHIDLTLRLKRIKITKERASSKKGSSLLNVSTTINPVTNRRYPSAFEVAEAWNPAKSRNNYPLDPVTVARLSLYTEERRSAEELAKRKFSLKNTIRELQTTARSVEEVLEGKRQYAIMLSFWASKDKAASKLRAYGQFCDLMNVNHFPVNTTVIEQFAAIHTTEPTLEGYLGALANAEMFTNVPHELQRQNWGSKTLKQIGRGLKKYHVKKKRSAFSPIQTRAICCLAPKIFNKKFATKNMSEKFSLKFTLLVRIAYIFCLRLENEALDIELGDDDDRVDSALRGRTHVIFNTEIERREMTVIKLQERKNRKQYKPEGYTIVRYCSCGKDPRVDRHQVGSYFCPVHTIMPLIQDSLIGDNLGLDVRAGEKIFEGLTNYLVLKYLREIVTLSPLTLGKPEEAGLHSFRRGAATEAFKQGESEEKTRALGDWKSRSAADSYIPEHARNTIDAAVYIQGWEDSDGE